MLSLTDLETLIYNYLLDISIWISNRRVRLYVPITTLLIFPSKPFSCITIDSVSYSTNVEFIFAFSLFILHTQSIISKPCFKTCPKSIHFSPIFSTCTLTKPTVFSPLNYHSSLINVLWPHLIFASVSSFTVYQAHCSLKHAKLPHVKLFPLPGMLLPQIFSWLVPSCFSDISLNVISSEISLTT